MDQFLLPFFEGKLIDTYAFGSSVIDDRALNAISTLYNLTDWRWVWVDGRIEHEYNGMSIISILKALAIPYLINITSERAISKVIISTRKLQVICGFQPDRLPESRSFWHFRNKYKLIYPELILRTLISLVLSGKKPQYNLPFVERINLEDIGSDTHIRQLQIDEYRPPISLYVRPKELELPPSNADEVEFQRWRENWFERLRNSDTIQEYKEVYEQYQNELLKNYRQKTGFLDELELPIDVSTQLINNQTTYFRLTNPEWFGKPTGAPISFPKTRSPYDKACNILVPRGTDDNLEILMCRRKETGYGQGEYALPGGKQKPGESLEECARRELFEETNLKLYKSRPVSVYIKKDPSNRGKDVISVGVLAEEWGGELALMEPRNHEEWIWCSLSNMPAPIFEPARIAIDHYRQNKFPSLRWDEFEESSKQLTYLEDF
jgi:8-oxo-dGTP diphosphatase